MSGFQVTIVGLGVSGASFGLALKQASREFRIVGHDREPSAAAEARKMGAVDRTEWNLPNACRGADLVILALPLPAIRDTLAVIAPELPTGCLVTDTASVKEPVLAWARELLPSRVNFVGGDPIGARGRATTARADLFSNTTYCLCPDSNTPPEAVEQASNLATAVGATPRFMDAAEHDGLAAALEQLPFILSVAALQTASASSSWRELAKLGGERFERLLALQGDNPDGEFEAIRANAANIGRWLSAVQAALESLRGLLASGEPAVHQEAVKRLTEARAVWDRHESEPVSVQPDYKAFSIRRLLGFR